MTWLVTGGSSGVGRVMAVALAGAGHRVLLTARNTVMLADTQLWCPGSQVIAADLADPLSVDALALQVAELTRDEGLAGIVHAAGVMSWDSPATASGWSRVPAVNALAPWRLTNRLEPSLLASDHPRVLFVAGAAFTLQGVVPTLEGWRGEQKGRGMALALEAASAKVFMARELHRRWSGRGSVFAFHPGFVKSHLADGLPFPIRFLVCLAQGLLAARSANGEFLALDAAAPTLSGNLVDGKRAKPGCPVPEDAVDEAAFLAKLPA